NTFHGLCPYHVVRPVRGTSCGATLRSVDVAALLRGLSAQQRTGPAPVALGAEELHPLYLVLFFHVTPNPGQGRGVVGEIARVNDIPHPVEKPIAGHADQPSARRRPKPFSCQRLYGVCCRNGLWHKDRDATAVIDVTSSPRRETQGSRGSRRRSSPPERSGGDELRIPRMHGTLQRS